MHGFKKMGFGQGASRRSALLLAGVAPWLVHPSWAQVAGAANWAGIESRARGQKVFFNAWGGSDRVNAYLQWAAAEVQRLHGVGVEHVKLTDTVEAVRRVRNEKAAGRTSGGRGRTRQVGEHGDSLSAGHATRAVR